MDNSPKILIIISGLRFQNNEGAKNRLNSFITSYSRHGYRVTVLLFFSLSSLFYVFRQTSYLNNMAKWILFPNVPVSKNAFLSRLSLLFRQVIVGLISRLKRYDLIQMEISGAASRYCSKNSLLIVDFHGDSVSEIIYRNNNESYWLSRLATAWQRASINSADHIIVVSEALKCQLEINTKTQIRKYSVISCGVDTSRFQSAIAPTLGLNLKHKIVLGYCGGLQKWQNFDSILFLISSLIKINPNIFLMIYSNDNLKTYHNSLAKLGDTNYAAYSLSPLLVPSYLKLLDAGLIIREENILNVVASPTKIPEYLASGVPVICTPYCGDVKTCVLHRLQGFILENTFPSASELAALNDYLITVKHHRSYYARQCIQAARKRSWDVEFSQFLESIMLPSS